MTDTPPPTSASPASAIEVWVDLVCPWCFLGERRLAVALGQLGASAREAVVWRSFELDPRVPREPARTATEIMLAAGSDPASLAARWAHIRQLGVAEGVRLDPDATRPTNTHDAHRLVHVARTLGRADAVVRRLLHAYHVDRQDLAATAVLVEVGRACGVPAAAVEELLDGDRFSAEVRRDQARAARLGVRSVPTVIVGERTRLSLLRPADELAAALSAALSATRRP